MSSILLGLFARFESLLAALAIGRDFYSVAVVCLIDILTAEFVVLSSDRIAAVLGGSGSTQVFPAVVRRVVVYMVNIFFGERALHIEEGQPVSFVHRAKHLDLPVPPRVRATGSFPYTHSSTSGADPREHPRFGVVVQNFFQLGLCNHGAIIARGPLYGNP